MKLTAKQHRARTTRSGQTLAGMEPLEGRTLMSASPLNSVPQGLQPTDASVSVKQASTGVSHQRSTVDILLAKPKTRGKAAGNANYVAHGHHAVEGPFFFGPNIEFTGPILNQPLWVQNEPLRSLFSVKLIKHTGPGKESEHIKPVVLHPTGPHGGAEEHGLRVISDREV